jgi:hypothetical protein
MASKSREEIENLKRDWEKDPCYDIEDADGFEEHREELIQFSQKKQIEWKEMRIKSEQKKRDRLNQMKTNENVWVDPLTEVLKVPGGWLYKFYRRDYNLDIKNLVTSTFVPELKHHEHNKDPDQEIVIEYIHEKVETWADTLGSEKSSTAALNRYEAMVLKVKDAVDLIEKILRK